mmetsp:Transcript_13587/g.26617  ORF Transcript_13587/g.26617 Transcript_13587/m.26617 type:complete len:246 (-) Transcript_13587:248-985(-)
MQNPKPSRSPPPARPTLPRTSLAASGGARRWRRVARTPRGTTRRHRKRPPTASLPRAGAGASGAGTSERHHQSLQLRPPHLRWAGRRRPSSGGPMPRRGQRRCSRSRSPLRKRSRRARDCRWTTRSRGSCTLGIFSEASAGRWSKRSSTVTRPCKCSPREAACPVSGSSWTAEARLRSWSSKRLISPRTHSLSGARCCLEDRYERDGLGATSTLVRAQSTMWPQPTPRTPIKKRAKCTAATSLWE